MRRHLIDIGRSAPVDGAILVEAVSSAPVKLPSRLRMAAVAAPILGVSWVLLWSDPSFWSPLFFFGTWLGATLLMYAAGERGHPGWRRHTALALVSTPLWWWFELVNDRVGNWEYILSYDYNSLQYALMASVAFSTVVPALDSAWRLTTAGLRFRAPAPLRRGTLFFAEIAAGVGTLALVFGFPDVFFPLVWVSPFLVIDGVVGLQGGRSLVQELRQGEWRLAAGVGLAGMWCGALWEFWNYWSGPKWVYDVSYLGYLKVFEMPIVGYLGYVPFAWAAYQITKLRQLQRYLR